MAVAEGESVSRNGDTLQDGTHGYGGGGRSGGGAGSADTGAAFGGLGFGRTGEDFAAALNNPEQGALYSAQTVRKQCTLQWNAIRRGIVTRSAITEAVYSAHIVRTSTVQCTPTAQSQMIAGWLAM